MPKQVRLPTLAALRSLPRKDGATAIPVEVLDGDAVLWRWPCPHCDTTVAEPLTTPRASIVDDPACVPCRAESLGLDMRTFLKAQSSGCCGPKPAHDLDRHAGLTRGVPHAPKRLRCLDFDRLAIDAHDVMRSDYEATTILKLSGSVGSS